MAGYAEGHPQEVRKAALDYLRHDGRLLIGWDEFERELARMTPWEIFCAGYRAGGDPGSFRWTDRYVATDGGGDFITVGEEEAEELCEAVWHDRGFAQAVFDGTVEVSEEAAAAVRDEWGEAE